MEPATSDVKNAYERLKETLQREPTNQEIARDLADKFKTPVDVPWVKEQRDMIREAESMGGDLK